MLFPPQLIPVLRDRLGEAAGGVGDVGDELLVQLLTTVFFAGLEIHEGEHNPVRVVFIGDRRNNVVVPAGAESATAPIYQWKLRRFVRSRPFTIAELVKLAVACAADRTYSVVHVLSGGELGIAGLASEGFNVEHDPFMKVIAPKPGCLSIGRGREHLLEYERGAVSTRVEDAVFSAQPVRRALELAAGAAGLQGLEVDDYIDAVRGLVREMAMHGRGGILVISASECPAVSESERYRMREDTSLTALLRLARRIGHRKAVPDHLRAGERNGRGSFRHVLRTAFLREAERMVQELGAVTRIDGATVLSRDLALVAFGVILPVDGPPTVTELMLGDALGRRNVDLGVWGTRHRAAATYAAEHPGSTVFVASEDGHVRCMLREPSRAPVLLWHLGSAYLPAA